MNLVTKLSVATGLLLACAFNTSAADYTVNSKLSSLSLATIKKQYVVEAATINKLSGSLSDKGDFTLSVDLAGLDTVNPIRDQRLRDLFFEIASHPQINVRSQINQEQIPEAGSSSALSLKAELEIWSQRQTLDLNLLVTNTGNSLVVSSTKPLIIKAENFGIPAKNLASLAGTVGDIQIAQQAPVNVNLVLDLKP